MQVYENFISYRRGESDLEVKSLFDELQRQGFPTFCDVYTLASGDFAKDIEAAITTCTNFILVLSPESLVRCTQPGDWLTREISLALAGGKNIVPVYIGDVVWPATLPASLKALRDVNAIEYEVVYFESFVSKLVSQFLTPNAGSRPGQDREDFVVEDGVLTKYEGSARIVVIPDGVHAIAAGVFKDHTEIERLTLPESLTEIRERAFERCINLTYFALPPRVRRLGAFTFSRCYRLAYAEFNEGLQSIGAGALSYCAQLKRVQLNDGLASLDSSAFNHCAKLETIALPHNSDHFTSHEGMLLSRGGSVLVRCPEGWAGTVAALPDTVEEIAPWAFSGCVNLSEIIVPRGLRTVGAFAFQNCTGIAELELFGEITSFAATALNGWSSRQKVRASKEIDGSIRRGIEDQLNRPLSSRTEPVAGDGLIVKTMFESVDEARQMARMLLDQGLIAAGQIGARESLYWWDSRQHSEAEWELSCLTRVPLYAAVEKFILSQHSFEVAEIIGIPIVAISDPFASWIAEYAVEQREERGNE